MVRCPVQQARHPQPHRGTGRRRARTRIETESQALRPLAMVPTTGPRSYDRCGMRLAPRAGPPLRAPPLPPSPSTLSETDRMTVHRQDALDYHAHGRPGKIAVVPTKPAYTQRDLGLAYSPGVAEPCREIARDPEEAFRYTARGNLVAVVSNGTAVLGLGNLGALASKPVMEGK